MAFNPLTALFGSKRERDIKTLLPRLHLVNELEAWAMSMAPEEFPTMTAKLRARISSGEALDAILPEAFALAREAARRVLGERAFDTQVLGSIVLHDGKIVEMKTGEGKTLSSVAAAYLNSLEGKGVHVVTVNDYLAERDAGWMGTVFTYLGVSVGAILSNMDNDARRVAYGKDITYGTNNEFGFDYLRDNMVMDPTRRVQRGHHYCIVDEIDSILVDEARTPLIISGAAEDDTYKINEVVRLAHHLVEVEKDPKTGEYPKEEEGESLTGDYKIEEKSKKVSFTSDGLAKMEDALKKRGLIQGSLFDEQNFEFVHYFTQAIRARELFHKDTEYVVQEGLVQIVDEFTGPILHGRRYSDGLHEAIEAKERIKIARRNRTLATITFQNYFRMYDKIAGMTGTAETESVEFQKIYELDVVVIPTNRPVARLDEDDLVFLNENEKFEAICDEIVEAHAKGQPMLVGTVSIDKSERLSAALTRRGVKHEVLNAKNHAREATIIAEAGSRGAVTIATNMAGRGTDIKLGGNPEYRARKKAGSTADEATVRKVQAEEFQEWSKDYEAVKAAGGLYVLGTERHESRRIDNQLRGRSGRQGDPGRSRFFISLDDDLMRLFGGTNLKGLMMKVGMKEGEPIYHPLLNKTMENAQKRVEERNFDIRKHLLEYDDVLNQQRKFIYGQRDTIVKDQDLPARVMAAAREMLDVFIQQYEDGLKSDAKLAYAALQDNLKSTLGFNLPFKAGSSESRNLQTIKAAATSELDRDVEEKLAMAGSENLNHFLRWKYLQAIDQKWLDHLENMEALREAVYLRHYAQKNPLLEYKLEGFELFDVMIEDIRKSVASTLFLVRIQRQEDRTVRQVASGGETRHDELGQFGGASGAQVAQAAKAQAAGGAIAQAAAPRNATVVRTYPKVGRNDPCPCGSGKKYKHCHGA